MTENQSLPINNPAERLYVILSRASQANKDKTIIAVLSEAMEVESNPNTFIMTSSELFSWLS
jgi:hypothetical protein